MRLAVFRRSRLIAGLLFAASPAVGGTVLPAIHPCPVDSPWLAHHDSAPAASGHHHHDAGAGGHEQKTCHCIGSCLTGTAMVPPRADFVTRHLTVAAPVLLPAHDSALSLEPRSTLLPPATAPPLV